jgi:hypothetical protein
MPLGSPGGAGSTIELPELNLPPNSLIHINSAGIATALADASAGKVLTANGTTSVPSWETPAVAGAADFAFAYSTANQAIVLANTFQDLTFNVNKLLNGWTHTVGTNLFTCPSTGNYIGVVVVNTENTSDDGSATAAIRALFNGVEVAGSHAAITINDEDSPKQIARSFQFAGVATQDLELEFSASSANVRATPGPNPGAATTPITAYISIHRIN